MKNYRGYLKKEYNRIFNSSKKDLINNNIDIDKNLLDISQDKRLSLTVIIPINVLFKNVIDQLNKLEPEQYFYPSTDTHITVIDFICDSDNSFLDKEKIEQCKMILNNSIKNFSGFYINFKGLTASQNAVMVQGFFDTGLQDLRNIIRKECVRHGFELKERHQQTWAHSAIMRFKKKLKNPELFVNEIETLRNTDFGSVKVNKILFVLHDWYNIKEKTKILQEYKLK